MQEGLVTKNSLARRTGQTERLKMINTFHAGGKVQNDDCAILTTYQTTPHFYLTGCRIQVGSGSTGHFDVGNLQGLGWSEIFSELILPVDNDLIT